MPKTALPIWHFFGTKIFEYFFLFFLLFAHLRLILDKMVQVKWARTYLSADGKCNILVNGIACGKSMRSKSSTVKQHTRKKHPGIFREVIGKVSDLQSANYDTILTNLTCYFAMTPAPISHLSEPSFKVYFQLVISKTVTLENLESNSHLREQGSGQTARFEQN
jgi:hypothetical protein